MEEELKSDIRHFFVRFPDGREYHDKLDVARMSLPKVSIEMLDRAMGWSGLVAPRSKPTKIELKLFEVEVSGGELVHTPLGSRMVDVPIGEMIESDRDAEMNKILARLPTAVARDFVCDYSIGHGETYEDQIDIGCELAAGINRILDDDRKGPRAPAR